MTSNLSYYCFELNTDCDSDQLWTELSNEGYQILYGLDEPDGAAKLFGLPPHGGKPLHPSIASATPCYFDAIDWNDQWGVSQDEQIDGAILVDLGAYLPGCQESITIEPGPGFGDLSHPTTKLILSLMSTHIKDKFVLDVGSGSGILSLAAAQMGAAQVHGIDIDPDAVTHAQKNALKKKLHAPISFGLPHEAIDFDGTPALLIAMNMITSEQMVAWKSLNKWHRHPADIFTSGVLIEQRDEYLSLCSKWGWQLIDERTSDGWQAFHFKTAPMCIKK